MALWVPVLVYFPLYCTLYWYPKPYKDPYFGPILIIDPYMVAMVGGIQAPHIDPLFCPYFAPIKMPVLIPRIVACPYIDPWIAPPD